MTKFLFFIILFLSLISCGKIVCEKPILEIKMINKANSFLGGKKLLVIRDSVEIQKIDSMLSKLGKKDLARKISAKQNYGYIEIVYSSNDCKNMGLMELVFTKNSGDLIHYNSDNDLSYEYYVNQNLINHIKKKMNINESVGKMRK